MRVPADFKVDVRRSGPAVVIAPHGELDLVTTRLLRSTLEEQRDTRPLVLDLRGVSFMDSIGLALVVEEHRRATSEGLEFRVVPGPDAVQRVFEMTGLTRHLTWVENPPATAIEPPPVDV